MNGENLKMAMTLDQTVEGEQVHDNFLTTKPFAFTFLETHACRRHPVKLITHSSTNAR